MRILPALLAALAFTAPAPLAAAVQDAPDEWFNALNYDICSAVRNNGREPVIISLSNINGMSGIDVFSTALAFAERHRDYPDVTIRVNGGPPIAARARGVVAPSAVGAGIYFAFDPRPLLAAHPDGFTIEVLRDGRVILATALHAARAPFTELAACATRLPPPPTI